MKWPFIEKPIIYNVRSKPRNYSSPTGSKGCSTYHKFPLILCTDLQMVNITLRVLSKPDFIKLPLIYQTLGTDYDDRVLPSIVNEVLKSVVVLLWHFAFTTSLNLSKAQFNASQLITQREQVSMLIRERLTERAKDFFINMDDVSIVSHRSFDSFSHICTDSP